MKHRDRGLLLTAVTDLVEDIYGHRGSPVQERDLSQRLDSLLDTFLLESQPIKVIEATILLVDIRGFTNLTESLSANLVIELLNRYLTLVCRVIKRHGGLVDKFMGDSVMALFGAPDTRDGDLLRALICAVEIQRELHELNRLADARNELPLFAGVAVNTGRVMVGSFGSCVHNEYSAIGDAVNLAARMEAYSLRGQILLSESSYAGAREQIEIEGVNQVMVKYKSKPVSLFELRAVNYPERLVVPRVDVRKSPRVLVDFPVALHRVEYKRVLPENLTGQALDLSYSGMLIDLPLRLEAGADLVMRLSPHPDSGIHLDVYGRVLRSTPRGGSYGTSLKFTSLDTPGYQRIKRYVDEVLWGR